MANSIMTSLAFYCFFSSCTITTTSERQPELLKQLERPCDQSDQDRRLYETYYLATIEQNGSYPTV